MTVGLGLAVTAALMAVLSLGGKRLAEQGMQEWDEQWLRAVERDGPLSFHSSIWWEAFGSSALLIPLVVCATLFVVWRGRLAMAATIAASYLLHDPIVLLGWRLWDRARPELIAGGIAAPPLHSYPSGHVVQTVAVYGLFAYLWMRSTSRWAERALALLLTAALIGVVGYARLRLGAHWPSDEIAALVIGVVWLLWMIAALRGAERAGAR